MSATFEPILGGGFDQIAAQRFGWSQANNATDAGNINRLNEAEQARNNWNLRNQQILQQQADAQDKSDEEAQKFAEGQRQFDISAGLSGEANKTRYGEERARTEAINNQTKAKQIEAAKVDASVESVAKTLAPDAHEYSSNLDTAQQRFNDATTALDTKGAELQNQVPAGKVSYSAKAKGFAPNNPQDAEAAKAAADANLKMATAKADFDKAKTDFTFHQKRLNDLTKHASNYGLIITRKGDQWMVVNPANGKTYSSSGDVKTVQANRFSPVMGARQMADETSMSGQPQPSGAVTPGSNGFWNRFLNPWSSGSDQAPASPVGANRFSSAPANPYIAGRQYGNLRYNGGDPNDQTNWQQAQ